MGPVVVDIETVGRFDSLGTSVQEYLIEREEKRLAASGETGDARANVVESLPLNPAAGTIAAIGLYLINDQRSLVLINNEENEEAFPTGHVELDPETVVYYGSEAQILRLFWAKLLEKAGPGGRYAAYPVITFNGRYFDGPFLMLRSAVNGIQPTRNLVGSRYTLSENCDLLEVLTFMGTLSWQHRYSLDFWCSQFGIESPKQDMDGSMVGEVWRSGDFERLVRYSLSDLKATAQLYEAVQPLIEVQKGS
ncbi:MAG: ribonuclease H-like domain-containing protein [Candidatus Wallacebacter cryptica]|jgi:DNA polymerase elongation subunit (family B)|nr:3'-5' exonuclease [Bacillota bacterium]